MSSVDRSGRSTQRSANQPYVTCSRRLLSPPPSRSSRGSPATSRDASHHSSPSSSVASPSVPPVEKWSVNALRQALSNAGISFSRRSSKAQLHDLLVHSSQNTLPPLYSKDASKQSSTTRAIRFASNSPQYQHPAAATASSFTAHSSRQSTAAAHNKRWCRSSL